MSETRFVVNASPLIFLSQIKALPLLRQLSAEVIVPSAVCEEVMLGDSLPPGASPVELPDWLRVEPDLDLPLEIAAWDLGAGESQVLAHAVRLGACETVLDDLQARRCARVMGLPTTGTLGLVLRARKSGLIPLARPLIEELLRRKLYLSRDLVKEALAEVGE